MKLGLILECSPGGADEQVFRCLIERFWAGRHRVVSVAALRGKGNLFVKCGQFAVRMLADGCDLVLIIWDLHPGWVPEDALPRKGKVIRDCVLEANHLRALASAAGAPQNRLLFLCIDDELESILLADETAIRAVIAESLAPRRPKPLGKSLADRSKDTLELRFDEQGIPFFDHLHDLRIVRAAKKDRLFGTPPLQRLALPDKLGPAVSDVDCNAMAAQRPRKP